MKKLIPFLALLALLPASALATTVTATTVSRTYVDTACVFSAPANISALIGQGGGPTARVGGSLSVGCPLGQTFRIDPDTGYWGLTTLNHSSTASTLTARLLLGNVTGPRAPFTAGPYGHNYEGTGTGYTVQVPFSVEFNTNEAGNPLPAPENGTYTGTVTWTMMF